MSAYGRGGGPSERDGGGAARRSGKAAQPLESFGLFPRPRRAGDDAGRHLSRRRGRRRVGAVVPTRRRRRGSPLVPATLPLDTGCAETPTLAARARCRSRPARPVISRAADLVITSLAYGRVPRRDLIRSRASGCIPRPYSGAQVHASGNGIAPRRHPRRRRRRADTECCNQRRKRRPSPPPASRAPGSRITLGFQRNLGAPESTTRTCVSAPPRAAGRPGSAGTGLRVKSSGTPTGRPGASPTAASQGRDPPQARSSSRICSHPA